MTSSSTTRSRRQTLTKNAGGPSRLKNKRQAKIVEMIDGYDSTVTLATALRNILLVWVIPGLAFVILGGMGFGSSTRLMEDQHLRWLGAVRPEQCCCG